MTTERPRRVNGLSPPYTAAQVSTWVLLPLVVSEFCLFVSPILPITASIPCTLVFGAFALASTYFGYLAMTIDPKDPRLPSSSSSNHNGHNTSTTKTPSWDRNEPTKQCWICDVQVGEKSMHCKFCNKCVDHFDHHCMWLNTCVGKANYRYFFRCMVSIAIMLLIQAVIQIALILDIFLGNGATKQRADDWFQLNASIAVVVVMAVFVFFNFGALSLLGQLLLFHLRLQREGLSTYQFVVQDNRRRREIARKEDELKLRRQMAIAHATNEGKTCYVIRLEQGGFLRDTCGLASCDPLSLEVEQDEENAEKAPENGTATGRKSNRNGHATTISNDTAGASGPFEEEDDIIDDKAKETEVHI